SQTSTGSAVNSTSVSRRASPGAITCQSLTPWARSRAIALRKRSSDMSSLLARRAANESRKGGGAERRARGERREYRPGVPSGQHRDRARQRQHWEPRARREREQRGVEFGVGDGRRARVRRWMADATREAGARAGPRHRPAAWAWRRRRLGGVGIDLPGRWNPASLRRPDGGLTGG